MIWYGFFLLDFSISWYEDVLNTFFENINQSDNEQPVKTSSKVSGSCCWNPEKQLRFNWLIMKILWSQTFYKWALCDQKCLNKSETKSLMFHYSFMICKISKFNMWTAKHLVQASCTELTLQPQTWTAVHAIFVSAYTISYTKWCQGWLRNNCLLIIMSMTKRKVLR